MPDKLEIAHGNLWNLAIFLFFTLNVRGRAESLLVYVELSFQRKCSYG